MTPPAGAEGAVLGAAELLFTQGFGTRRACAALVRAGALAVAGRVVDDAAEPLAPEGLEFTVHGRPWVYQARATVLLHKPAGYECSQRPGAWPSVLELLPAPLRTRGVQPVGRLDADTTGALLLTDDGALNHRLTHPKRHVAKVYQVRTARPVTPNQVQALLEGVLLDDETEYLRAAGCVARGERALELTLTQGKYHQVKRMVAAAGNHVEALHRSAFGPVLLDDALAPGQWRWLDAAELASLAAPAPRRPAATAPAA